MGRIKDLTGSYTGGLLSLSAAGLVAMIIVLVFPHQELVEHAPSDPLSLQATWRS